jgi:hypothetical protein
MRQRAGFQGYRRSKRRRVGVARNQLRGQRHKKPDSERERQTFQFNNFNREVFLLHTENFQVAEGRLLRLRVPVDFDTQEIPLILPM